jgi:hypothetical protein
MSDYIYRIDEGLQFFALQSGIAERNANELRRADREVHDIADGRYDGRIQKFILGRSLFGEFQKPRIKKSARP